LAADAGHGVGELSRGQGVVEHADASGALELVPGGFCRAAPEAGVLADAQDLPVHPRRDGEVQVRRRGRLDEDVLLSDGEEVQ
jgi:hypothetical protein